MGIGVSVIICGAGKRPRMQATLRTMIIIKEIMRRLRLVLHDVSSLGMLICLYQDFSPVDYLDP